MTVLPPPTVARILAARRAIDPVFLDTPLFAHPAADAALGCRHLAKIETLNPTRAFKGRGTGWYIADQGTGSGRTLVTASAGNFGQGIAYACAKVGVTPIIFAGTSANLLKIAAMRALGADVRIAGADFDGAKIEARAYAAREGLTFVEDAAHPCFAEGAGTMALEVTRDLDARGEDIDIALIALGNGALLTGIGTWLKVHRPQCHVVGVVAAAAPSMQLSWEQKRLVTTPTAPTIADGIGVREPIPYVLDCMPATVDEVIGVSEASLVAAMRFAHTHYGLVLEPSGAVGLAAILEHRARVAGRRVLTIFCGGNLTPDDAQRYLN
jgi:threonine dehydratase